MQPHLLTWHPWLPVVSLIKEVVRLKRQLVFKIIKEDRQGKWENFTLHVATYLCHIDLPYLFLPITIPNMLQQLEQFHPCAFILGEVKNLETNMGLIRGTIPPILFIIYHSPCILLLLRIFQMYQIIFMNDHLFLLLQNIPLVQPKLNPCPPF